MCAEQLMINWCNAAWNGKHMLAKQVSSFLRNIRQARFNANCPDIFHNIHEVSGIVHDGIVKWKHFLRYWPFVWGIHPSPVNSPHKGQWHGALMFSLICPRINGWVNNRDVGDLRCHCTHYDITTILCRLESQPWIRWWLGNVRQAITWPCWCHRFCQKWQLRVCKWNFRVCKIPILMKIPMKIKEFG